MLDSGVLIDERHEIGQLLGRGGMAEVFRAWDTVTGRPVAIKLLRTVDPRSMSRFRSEIEVLSHLDHPGVVRLLGTGCHDGVPYLVLELVDGPSLADILDSGPLGIERSISIGRQLAQALAHAHGLGIVHRDVKPANVIFDAEPTRVRLADFGIARFGDTTRMTGAGLCIGTPAYLAPEQLEGHVGPAADVYALGLVVLECLTGTVCYPGTAAETTLARLHRSPVVPVDLPSWLRHSLRAMTARDPRRRPLAAAVADAFGCRSVDPVLASTAEVDVTDLSTPAPPGTAVQDIAGSNASIERGRATEQSADTGAGRRRLQLAFGGGALTSAMALAALALSLMVWPFGAGALQATEPKTPPILTSKTVEASPTPSLLTPSLPIRVPVAPTLTTLPVPPSDTEVPDAGRAEDAADAAGPDSDDDSDNDDDDNDSDDDRGRGRGHGG